MSASSGSNIQDVSRQAELYACSGIMTSVQFLSTIYRIGVKVAFRQKLEWADVFIILSSALNITTTTLAFIAVHSGVGRHMLFLTTEQRINAVKFGELSNITTVWALFSVKVSICLFLLNLIRRTNRKIRFSIYAFLVVVTLVSLLASLFWGLQARPLPKLWNPSIPGQTIGPQRYVDFLYVGFALHGVTDLFCALSPIFFLWDVQMSMRKKMTIILLIGSGVCVSAIAFLQIAFVNDLSDIEDLSWTVVNDWLCDAVTRNGAVIVANLPSLWSLTRQAQAKYSLYTETRRLRSSDPSRGGSYPKTNTEALPSRRFGHRAKTDMGIDSRLSDEILLEQRQRVAFARQLGNNANTNYNVEGGVLDEDDRTLHQIDLAAHESSGIYGPEGNVRIDKAFTVDEERCENPT